MITLSSVEWKIASTMVNNETMKVEFFEEDRDGYAGCGEYDGEFFRTKPTGDIKNEHMVNIPRNFVLNRQATLHIVHVKATTI